jgi:hypothetical protein
MTSPVHRLQFPDSSRVLTNELLIEAKIVLRENALSTATISIDNESDTYPYEIDGDGTVLLQVGEDTNHLNSLFYGWVNFPVASIRDHKRAVLECDHIGFSLAEMLVAQEYGAQSSNPTLDTIAEILTDASYGIVPKYVNKILGSATDSGYNLSTTGTIDAITGTINYIAFPFKPADKCLNDLCDLVTALKAGSAGPHWIVDNDGNLRVKLVTSNQAYVDSNNHGWTKYYGGADNTDGQANITLGEDIDLIDYEAMKPEANYIVYYGNWRRPSNGDAWTNTGCDSIWTGINSSGFTTVLSVDTSNKIVGTSSLKALNNSAIDHQSGVYIPTGKQAGWDFSTFTDFNVPTLNFYIRVSGTITNLTVGVYNIAGDGETIDAYGTTNLSSDVTESDKWYHFSLPLGPYYNTPERFQTFKWYGTGTLDWSAIDAIQLFWTTTQNSYVNIDGFYFGDANICRVAYNSTLTPYSMKLITDDIGKDDTLKAADDSGLMAQLAYAELLRQQKPTNHTTIKTPMLPTALPGQWFSLQGFDYRATKIVHEIKNNDYTTTLYLTDDLTNGRTRPRWEDINRQYANIRPEFQDRQASNLKAGSIDWRIARLVKDYAT